MATATASRPKAKPKGAAVDREKRARQAAILLKQMSDPTRLQIAIALADGELHVGAICDVVGMGQPATSHHLALMRHGGIIVPRRSGKQNFYSLTDTGRELAKVVRGMVQ